MFIFNIQIGILTSFATANQRLQSATAQGDQKAVSKAQESLVSLVASTGRSDLVKKESGELSDIIDEQRKNGSISIDKKMWENWDLQCALIRHYNISVDRSTTPHDFYLIEIRDLKNLA